jgi:hypothetical protein
LLGDQAPLDEDAACGTTGYPEVGVEAAGGVDAELGAITSTEDAWLVATSLLRRAVTGTVTKRVVVDRNVDSGVSVDACVLVSLSHGSLSSGNELGSVATGLV